MPKTTLPLATCLCMETKYGTYTKLKKYQIKLLTCNAELSNLPQQIFISKDLALTFTCKLEKRVSNCNAKTSKQTLNNEKKFLEKELGMEHCSQPKLSHRVTHECQ